MWFFQVEEVVKGGAVVWLILMQLCKGPNGQSRQGKWFLVYFGAALFPQESDFIMLFHRGKSGLKISLICCAMLNSDCAWFTNESPCWLGFIFISFLLQLLKPEGIRWQGNGKRKEGTCTVVRRERQAWESWDRLWVHKEEISPLGLNVLTCEMRLWRPPCQGALV